MSKFFLCLSLIAFNVALAAGGENPVLCGDGTPCKAKGVDITTLNLTPVTIVVPKNFPDNGEKINLVAKIASQNTGGKDVLFIHGFPHCHLLWKNQLAAACLRNNHNLYTIDMRGLGESDKPLPSAPPAPDGTDTVYRPWQNYANDIHQTIMQLGLHKPIIVVHSYAGFLLNDYLRMFTDKDLGGIVTVAAIPDAFLTEATFNLWFTDPIRALVLSGNLASTDLEKFIPSTQEFVELSSACRLHPQDLQEVLMYDSVCPGPIRNGIANHNGLPPLGTGLPSANDKIWQQVTVPTKVIHGIQDCVINFAAGEHLAQVIPTATLCLLKGVGHFPPLEIPKKFNRILVNFLSKPAVVLVQIDVRQNL